MTPIARFQQGAFTLDISSGAYALANFAPPSAAEDVQLAGGTSANRYRGAGMAGRRGANFDFGFSVRILGDSLEECEGAKHQLSRFLAGAGDEYDPLYFEYKSDGSYSVEPMWGQAGAFRRLEVEHAVVSEQPAGSASVRARGILCDVTLTVRPYITGKKQRILQAAGGIVDYSIGAADGAVRGTIVAEATTNECTNPVFGNATYDTDWTAQADLAVTRNTDPNYILFGVCSARIQRVASAAGGAFYQTRTFGVGENGIHTFSVYAKRPDSSAVTSGIISINYNGSNLTTTYTPVGDGWYRLTASANGIGGARNFGVAVAAGRTVYIDGYQLEELDHATPLCTGDMLGCAWTGVAHESTSTRTAGLLRLLSTADIATKVAGTIRLAVCLPFANTVSSDVVLFGGWLQLAFSAATDRWMLAEEAENAQSSVQSFAAGTIFVFHCVYSPSGMVLYINGAADGSNGTYTISGATDYFFLGSHSAVTSHSNALILGFSTFERAMTAGEVAGDYANIAAHVRGGDGYGQRLEGIPWLWTKDGDDIVDAYTDATHNDFAVAGGVGGDLPAETAWLCTVSSAGDSLILANNTYREYANPGNTFIDLGGTVVGGSLGGQMETTSVGTSETQIPSGIFFFFPTPYPAYEDKNIWMLYSLADAGSTLKAKLKAVTNTDLVPIEPTWQSVGSDATRRTFLAGPVRLSPHLSRRYHYVISDDFVPYLRVKRTTGTANVTFDWFRVLTGKMAYYYASGTPTKYLIDGARAFGLDSSYNLREVVSARGDVVDLEPDTINHIIAQSGDLGAATSLTTTVTFTRVDLAPRWKLL